MKQTISQYEFRRAFENMRPENFSYEGITALFDYFEEYEKSTGEEIELDVIAICCDFSEMTLQEAADNYGVELDDVLEYLQDHTQVIIVDDETVIISGF